MSALVLASASAHAHSFVLERSVVPVPGGTAVVSGTISTAPLSVDLVAHARHWKLGSIVLRDVAATARDRGDQILACLTGRVGSTHVRACTRVPRSIEALKELRGLDAQLRVSGATTGTGTARLAWRRGGRALRLVRGHVALAVGPRDGGPVTAGGATLVADAAGSLSPLTVTVTGEATSDDISFGALRVRDGRLPIAVALTTDRSGALAITPRGSMVADAKDLSLRLSSRTLVAIEPRLIVHDGTPFAPRELLASIHVLTTPRITGLPLDVHQGAAAFRITPVGVRLEHARVRTLGAELTLDDVLFDGRPFELPIHAHGVELARVLPRVTRDRMRGTGVLDGTVFLQDHGDGLALDKVALHARRAGTVHLDGYDFSAGAMRKVTGAALHKRIAATLADFGYDRLSLELAPRGSDPEARLLMSGHARRLPQALDLTVNLRGARDAAQHLLQRAL